MAPPLILDGLSDIAAGYDALFCDAWGVIHNGRELFPGVAEALTRFRETRGPVVILTNAPRPAASIPPQLDRLGLPREAYDGVVTSGEATIAEVRKRKGTPFFRLGPDLDDDLFEASGARFVSLDEAQAILCTGLADDLNETPEDYRDRLAGPAERGVPMICANPDRVVKFGDRMMYCAGSVADIYEQLGGEVRFCGKPHAPIYQACHDKLEEIGRTASRPLAIGDGIQTDILGANGQDMDVAFVAGGLFKEQVSAPTGRIDAQMLGQVLDDYGVTATYALNGLKW